MKNIHDKLPPVTGVYNIIDPDSGKSYVGSTNDLNRRRHEHLALLKKGQHYNKDLQALFDKNPNQLITFEETTSREEAYRKEQNIIKLNVGDLINVATDVKSSRKDVTLSQETKDKISTALTGFKHSEEFKEKARQIRLGGKHSEEHKRKISEGNKGRIVSDETRKKISIALSGKEKSQATKEALSKAASGRIMPESTRTALTKANTGRHPSEETREKLRQANIGNKNKLGHKVSEETRERMRQSWIIRKAKKESSL